MESDVTAVVGIYKLNIGGKGAAKQRNIQTQEQLRLSLTQNPFEAYFVIIKFGLTNITYICFSNSDNDYELSEKWIWLKMNIIDKKLQSNHVLTFSYILAIFMTTAGSNSKGSHIVIGSYLVPVKSMQLLPLGTCKCITPLLLNSL